MHEHRLSVKNPSLSVSSLNSVMHANVVSSHSQNNTGFGDSNRGGYSVRGNNYMNREGRGRGRASNRRIYYQLCGKSSHFVDKYYHRFDKNFQQQVPNKGLTRANDGNQYNNRAYIASFSDSNGAYMSEIGFMLGSHDGNNPRSSNFVA